MADQRLQVRELDTPNQLRSMGVGSYNVAVQRVSEDTGLRGFLRSVNELTQSAVELKRIEAPDLKEKAEAEVAKLSQDQLRKISQKGYKPLVEAGELPSISNPYYARYAEMAAGELSARETIGGKLASTAQASVRAGKDPYEALNKLKEGMFGTIGGGYQAMGAKRLLAQYDQQYTAMVFQEQDTLAKERVGAKLNSDVSAIINGMSTQMGNGAFEPLTTQANLSSIYKEAQANGVGIKEFANSIISNISRIEDVDQARNALLSIQETKLDNGITLGDAIPQTAWDEVENQIERKERDNLSIDGRQFITINQLKALNSDLSAADALDDTNKMAELQGTATPSENVFIDNLKQLADVDNDGRYQPSVQVIENAISAGDIQGAIGILRAKVTTGELTKGQYQQLARQANDAYQLRGVVSQRIPSVMSSLRITLEKGSVVISEPEMESMQLTFLRELNSEVMNFRANNPKATVDEIRNNMDVENGILQKAIDRTTKYAENRNSELAAEKVRKKAEETAAEALKKKEVGLNIPWMSTKRDGLAKAQQRVEQYTTKYSIAPQAITERETKGFATLNKWATDVANDTAQTASRHLNSGIIETLGEGGRPIKRKMTQQESEEAIALYSSAKTTLGYTYDEIASNITRDGIKLTQDGKNNTIAISQVNEFQTLLFKDKKELDLVFSDAKKLQTYTKAFGIVNTAEFKKRQETLLKLAGK